MSALVCPACHRTQVVATPRFCPFCGYSFAAGAPAGPTTETPGMPPSSYPPPAAAPGPGIQPQFQVRARPRPSPIKTSTGRAVGVTLSVVALALVAAYVLWGLLNSPGTSADFAFFAWVIGSHSISPIHTTDAFALAGDGLTFAYTDFMRLLIAAAPMTAVVSYWFSLRRLYQEWAPAVWFKTFWLGVAFLIGGITLVGAYLQAQGSSVIYRPLWALVMLGFYPALIFLVLLAALACAIAGIAFGRLFARWPLERIRALHSSALLDALLVLLAGSLALLAQAFLHLGLSFPLSAIAVAAFACWSALRPVSQTGATR